MATPVTAPMLGKIIQINVKPGDKVSENDSLMVMEAMKVEMDIASPAAGTITKILVLPGQQVEAETELAVIE
ncbi:MAG: acetyl-CoA carboxylase biotin carboxyl carrier protein subunit [Planctomycetes bacterium]|nr:acetyl-CoA carboxylase biotin carboxyl carrier protein subunit [Planctomycetota bacterium]